MTHPFSRRNSMTRTTLVKVLHASVLQTDKDPRGIGAPQVHPLGYFFPWSGTSEASPHVFQTYPTKLGRAADMALSNGHPW